MIRKLATGLFLLSVLAAAPAPFHAQQPAPTPDAREETDEEVVSVSTAIVTVPVSVLDKQGRSVPDLRREDFQLYEDGVEQVISHFATADEPFTVALALDTSGSARARLAGIQAAASAFVKQLRPADRVMLVEFADRIRVLVEPTSDHAKIHEMIRRTQTGNGTRLYDAIDGIIKQRLKKISGRKAVVLFTDGIDTGSEFATSKTTLRDAEEADALFFVMQYDTTQALVRGMMMPCVRNSVDLVENAASAQVRIYLEALASKTGGQHFCVDSVQNLPATFTRIAEELGRQYSLAFYPQARGEMGQRRKLKVIVRTPGVSVRARPAYIYNRPASAAGKK